MFLTINPHAAAATLCAQRDSTLSGAPDGDLIACLPFFNSNLPEYLPTNLADDYGSTFSAYSAPLVDIKPDLMSINATIAVDRVNARIERMMLCNRPPMYSSLEKPRYLNPGASSIGEPALLYRGLYHKVPKGATAYKVNRVLLQQMLLCSGRGQTRRGGPKQNSTTKPRQDSEGPITCSVVSAQALQLSMRNSDVENLTLKLDGVMPYRTSTEGAYGLDVLAWAGGYDSQKLTDEPDGVSVDSAGDARLWNDDAPMVHLHLKRGRLNSQYTFVSDKSERDVDRVDHEGCGDWTDHNMYMLLKDYVDEYGYNRSQIAGNVIPASSTAEDADPDDTPQKNTLHYAHACSPCIEDAIYRVLVCQLITMAVAYDDTEDGLELRRLWSTSPEERLADDDQQKLKLMLLKAPSALPMYCNNIYNLSKFLNQTIEGGGTLGESAVMASACEINYALNTPDNIPFAWDVMAGRPGAVSRTNPGAGQMLAILTMGNTQPAPPMRTRPLVGNAGFSASSWEESAQGIVFNPHSLCHARHTGWGNTIAFDYGVCVWNNGVAYALTAMGSVVPIQRTVSSDAPPQHLAGEALGVAEVGVNGYAEGGLSDMPAQWPETLMGANHFVFFFTNGGES